jgi:hypothetical protein
VIVPARRDELGAISANDLELELGVANGPSRSERLVCRIEGDDVEPELEGVEPVDVVEWFTGDQRLDRVDPPDAVDLQLIEVVALEDSVSLAGCGVVGWTTPGARSPRRPARSRDRRRSPSPRTR